MKMPSVILQQTVNAGGWSRVFILNKMLPRVKIALGVCDTILPYKQKKRTDWDLENKTVLYAHAQQKWHNENNHTCSITQNFLEANSKQLRIYIFLFNSFNFFYILESPNWFSTSYIGIRFSRSCQNSSTAFACTVTMSSIIRASFKK